jgi:hypothetical protein
MPLPGGNTIRPDNRPASRSFIPGRDAGQLGTARGVSSGRGCSTLTPGRAGWSRDTGRAFRPPRSGNPPGEGAPASASDHPRQGEVQLSVGEAYETVANLHFEAITSFVTIPGRSWRILSTR